jgi:hypothetical protein
MWDRIRRNFRNHQNFYLLLVLFVLFRLSIIVLYRPGGYLVDWWDYKFYFQHAQLSDRGLYPFLDYWMEYPPVFPWLVVGVYQLSLLIPPWLDEMFAFATLLGLVLLAFEVGNFVLVYRLGEAIGGRAGATRAAWVYAVLALPLYYLTGWFDCLPLFFLLLALYLATSHGRRATLTGLAIGVGFMVKLMPLLILPVAIQTLRRWDDEPGNGTLRRVGRFLWSYRWALVCAGAALVAIGVIAAPFLLARPDLFIASFVSMFARASWESVWAILDGYFWGGSIVAKWPQRADPATALIPQHGSDLPWLAISAAFALVYLVLWLLQRDWRDVRRVVAFTGLGTLLFLIYSKGYSPQFLVFVLPFVVLLLPGARGLGYIVLLTANNLAEWPFYHVMFTDHPWFLVWIVTVRTVLFLMLIVEFGWIAYGLARPRWARAWRWLSIGLAVMLALSFVPAGLVAVNDYRADRLAADPYREIIAVLTTEPAPGDPVLFTDRSLYKRFRPYLAPGQPLLFQTTAWDDVPLALDDAITRTLTDLAGRPGALWVVFAGTDADKSSNDVLEGWLSAHAYPATVRWFPNCRVARYAAGPDGTLQPTDVTFGDVARLTGTALAPTSIHPGDAVRVLLRWQSVMDNAPARTVFVHLRDAAGHTVAQRDASPANGFRPTSSWRAGEEVLDRHGVVVPPSTPAGTYTVVVGLYDPASGARVLLSTGGDELPIGTVEVAP